MRRPAALVLGVLAMMANVGVVLPFAAFYFRFRSRL
jgi:hypothetical protein